MAYPGRQNIYEATIRRMVQEALEQQEQEFREQHKEDTDQELLMYLRVCAIRLHHTPWPGEIVGGKLILERMVSFDQMPKEVWIQFSNMEEYKEKETKLNDILWEFPGHNPVVVYVREERKAKTLPVNLSVREDEELLQELIQEFGEKNVKVVKKSI